MAFSQLERGSQEKWIDCRCVLIVHADFVKSLLYIGVHRENQMIFFWVSDA